MSRDLALSRRIDAGQPEKQTMLKKTLLATAALAFIALGATSPASARDRDGNWDNGRNWKNYNHNYNNAYIQKPHHKQYGYWKYRQYPWLQYSCQPRWY
jgi:hypothetical protein